MKRVFGWIFLIIGALLGLSVIARMHEIPTIIGGIRQWVSGNLAAYDQGTLTARIIFFILPIFLTYIFLKIGIKWGDRKSS